MHLSQPLLKIQYPGGNIEKQIGALFPEILIFQVPTTYSTPDTACKDVICNILDSALKHIPQTSKIPKYPSCYWWTDECATARKNKNRALTKYKNHVGNINLWNEFIRLKLIFRKTVHEARKENWKIFLSRFSSSTSSADVWRQVRCLRNNPPSRKFTLRENNEYITSSLDIAAVSYTHLTLPTKRIV